MLKKRVQVAKAKEPPSSPLKMKRLIEKAKGFYYHSTILDAYAGGYIETLYEAPDKTRSVYTVYYKGEKFILKIMCYRKSMAKEIEQARKEWQLAYELARGNCHIIKPLDTQDGIDEASNIQTIETLYEYGGEDLTSLMGKLNAQELLVLIRKTLVPLVYLESRGVCHSDLKPENIVIKDGFVKLIDFGVAIDFQRRTELLQTKSNLSEWALGFTNRYCPPEIFNDHIRPNSGKIDVYCWGITIYQLITNKSNDELEHEQVLFKIPGKNYDDFLKIVANVQFPGDTDYSFTKLFVPILCRVLADNEKLRPTFSTLQALLGEPKDDIAPKLQSELDTTRKQLCKIE